MYEKWQGKLASKVSNQFFLSIKKASLWAFIIDCHKKNQHNTSHLKKCVLLSSHRLWLQESSFLLAFSTIIDIYNWSSSLLQIILIQTGILQNGTTLSRTIEINLFFTNLWHGFHYWLKSMCYVTPGEARASFYRMLFSLSCVSCQNLALALQCSNRIVRKAKFQCQVGVSCQNCISASWLCISCAVSFCWI